MLPNGDTGFYQYIDAEGHFVGRALPGFRGERGLEKLRTHRDRRASRVPRAQIFVWTVIFSACSVAFTLAIGMVLACLVQWEQLKGAWFLPGHAVDPALCDTDVHLHPIVQGPVQPELRRINLFWKRRSASSLAGTPTFLAKG